MNTDKEKLKSMFADFKANVLENIKKAIDSSNFPLEFLMYYDDVCLRDEIIKEIERMGGKKHRYSHSRYKHLVITIFEIIIRDVLKDKKLDNVKIDNTIVKNNIQIIHKNVDMLMDYYHVYIAKNAAQSNRYNVKIEENKYKFTNKEFNLEYNIQGYYEKNNIFQYKGDPYFEYCFGKPISSECIKRIYEWFVSNLDTLEESDDLGKYSVSEFLYVWSVIYFAASTNCVFKNLRTSQALKEYLDATAIDIKTAFESIFDFIKNSIDGKENVHTLIGYLGYNEFLDMILKSTNLKKETVGDIISDLIYNGGDTKYTLMQYPVLKMEDKIIVPSYYILNECHAEMLMKRKSKLLYDSTYSKIHKNVIEPRLCLKLKDALDVNKNFKIICSSETIKDTSSTNQSQIDIFIYDERNKDIMIIEVKDHIAKLDNVEVINQVNFEKNATSKGAIQQLENQENLIKIQRNLSLFLEDVRIEDINNIYLGYCETYYLGTPRFISDLENKKIAYMPYKLLTNMNKWSSVKKMYYYFLKARYLNDRNDYTYHEEEIKRFGYEIKIPMYENK
ncbi:hypothetical protein FDB37_08105 [Clostridium botulinum]|nr:hypothetical protein [Clostridium botulinum]NFO33582.1 hypothetical protein [Clostridium botulinum]